MGKYSDCWTYPMEVIDEKFDHVVPKETTVNNKPLSGNVNLTPSDIGAVPKTRTINDKPLSGNVTLTAADVGAVPASDMEHMKMVTLSTNDTTNGYEITFQETTSFVMLYVDNQGRVSTITKTYGNAPTIQTITSTDFTAKTSTTTKVNLKTANYHRAFFIIASLNMDHINIETYTAES